MRSPSFCCNNTQEHPINPVPHPFISIRAPHWDTTSAIVAASQALRHLGMQRCGRSYNHRTSYFTTEYVQ